MKVKIFHEEKPFVPFKIEILFENEAEASSVLDTANEFIAEYGDDKFLDLIRKNIKEALKLQ